jgi:hypothetical protein
MLFSEIMTAYRDNHKIINRISGQNVETCDVTAGRRVCGIIKKVYKS